MADGLSSITDKLVPSSISVGVMAPGEEYAAALAAVFKFSDDLLTILNSPAMIAARQRADIQAILNKDDADLAEAQKTGDVTKVMEDSTG